jgi:hypothetical protein
MAVIDWASYQTLLDGLRLQRSVWETATNYQGFSEAIARSCADLRGGAETSYGDYGLRSLEAGLTDNLSDEDAVYEQIRLVALAVPAPRDMGADWSGYFISSRSDGQQVCSADQFAAPASWVKVEVQAKDVAAPTATVDSGGRDPAVSARTFDEGTGLFYDQDNWYLPDGATIVTRVDSSDVFVDAARNRYRRGEAFQWYDEATGLLYDDSNWYLPDGVTIITDLGSGVFADSAGNRYRRGEAFQWYDPVTALLYDHERWYLPDGTTIVTEVENSDLFTDSAGNFYRLGRLVAPERAVGEAVPGADLVSRADGGQEFDEGEEGEEAGLDTAIAESIERNLMEVIDEIREQLELDEEEISDEEIVDLYLAEVRSLLEQ